MADITSNFDRFPLFNQLNGYNDYLRLVIGWSV